MELKEGMYVRYNGQIMKITELGYNNETFMSNGNGWFSLYNCKASHNIIELLEEKDLLEIEYFSLRYKKRVTRLFEVTFKDERYINLDNAKCQFMLIDNNWSNSDKKLEPIIKSIVTKEQFSQISYNLPKDK